MRKSHPSDVPQPHPSDAAPIDRFKKMARELGCDEDEAAFKEKLGKVARHKPKDGAEQEKPTRHTDVG